MNELVDHLAEIQCSWPAIDSDIVDARRSAVGGVQLTSTACSRNFYDDPDPFTAGPIRIGLAFDLSNDCSSMDLIRLALLTWKTLPCSLLISATPRSTTLPRPVSYPSRIFHPINDSTGWWNTNVSQMIDDRINLSTTSDKLWEHIRGHSNPARTIDEQGWNLSWEKKFPSESSKGRKSPVTFRYHPAIHR
jgi:hypothetical protein